VKNREDLGPKGRLQLFPNVKNKRIHEFLFIGWQVTGVRSNAPVICGRTQVHIRSQITAVAARANWACVRPLLLHATVGAFERTKCVRTHLAGISFFTWCILPFASHVLMQCPAQHKILKTLKIIRY
jgi:hypothetical protein